MTFRHATLIHKRRQQQLRRQIVPGIALATSAPEKPRGQLWGTLRVCAGSPDPPKRHDPLSLLAFNVLEQQQLDHCIARTLLSCPTVHRVQDQRPVELKHRLVVQRCQPLIDQRCLHLREKRIASRERWRDHDAAPSNQAINLVNAQLAQRDPPAILRGAATISSKQQQQKQNEDADDRTVDTPAAPDISRFAHSISGYQSEWFCGDYHPNQCHARKASCHFQPIAPTPPSLPARY